jgi:hypothetical protein
LFLLLAVVGIAMFSIQSTAHADFLGLKAKISGPLPTEAPTITNPHDGDHFDHAEIFVTGTCQPLDPSSIVVIYIDETTPGGSTICKDDNTYTVAITLPAGTHSLLAKIYNTTDDAGPFGSPIYVTYVPKTPPVTGSTSGGSTGGKTGGSSGGGACVSDGPLRIGSTPSYLYYGRSLAASWEFKVTGGCTPYTAVIDWGDGLADTLKVADNELQTARHGYADLRPAYFVQLRVTSADKQRATFSTVAITPYIPPVPAGGGLVQVEAPFVLSFEGNILKAYVAYVATLTLLGVIWYDTRVRRLRVAGVHIFPSHPDNPTDENGWRLRIHR